MQLRPYVKEIVFTISTYILLLFVATNVNITLGQTYLHFALGSLALLIIGITIFDKNLHITFQKKQGGDLQALAWGIGGWVILLIISSLVLKITSTSETVSSIIRLLGATTPALADSKFANFFTFGVLIAFIETNLWARGYEFICDLFNIRIDKEGLKKPIVWIIILALSFVFAVFHITSKGITNFSSLTIVFIMMAISLIMVTIFEETREAIYLHISANSVSSYLTFFGGQLFI